MLEGSSPERNMRHYATMRESDHCVNGHFHEVLMVTEPVQLAHGPLSIVVVLDVWWSLPCRLALTSRRTELCLGYIITSAEDLLLIVFFNSNHQCLTATAYAAD